MLFFAFNVLNAQTTIVQMQQERGGTYTIPCKVNGLSMRFIFDTGASKVCISSAEALFMLKNGYLSPSDIKGKQYSQIANGDIVEGMTIVLRKVEIEGLLLNNVQALVVNSLSAPLLFGQSAIQKLGPIKLDGDKLIIGKVSVLNKEQLKTKALDLNQRAYLADQSGRSNEAIKLYNEANEIYPLANSYDGLAYIYDKLGKREETIQASEQALALEPTNIQYEYNYGVSLYNGKKNTAAETILKSFYDHAMYNATHRETGGISNTGLQSLIWACNYLGDIYMKRMMPLAATKWLSKGIEHSKKFSKFGEDFFAYLKLGDIAFDSSKYREAIKCYRIGVSNEPNRLSNLPRYYKMGVSYKHIENIDSALLCFAQANQVYKANKKLTSKDDSDPEGLELYSYGMESILQEANLLFDNAAKRIPIDTISWAYYGLSNNNFKEVYNEGYGIINGQKGRFRENDMAKWLASAINIGDTASFKRSMFLLYKMYPNNINYLYMMADITGAKDKDMIPLYERAIKSSNFYMESKAEVLNNLAWSQCKIDDFLNAKMNAVKAIELDNTDPNKWETYGEALFGSGEYRKCIEAMNKSIELSDEKNTNTHRWLKNAYRLRGESYMRIGKKAKGKQDLEKSNTL